jgi:hypothetical protein
MRVATCLSGHSRNYKDNFPNMSFDTDYFISSCIESGLPNNNTPSYISYHSQNNVSTDLANIDDIVNLYKPKSHEFTFEKFIPREMSKYEGIKTTNNAFLMHIGMMFYRIYKSNLLKKEYEFNNNFKYDFVIRSRFDVKVNSLTLDRNYLHITYTDNIFCDLFFAGKSNVIDSISECYLWFIKQTPTYLSSFKNAEHVLSHYIEHLKLDVPYSHNFDITFNKDYPIEVKNIKNNIITPIYG